MFDDDNPQPPSEESPSSDPQNSTATADPPSAPETEQSAPPPPPPPPPEPALSTDEVADALTKALRSQNVEVPDSGVSVTVSKAGLFQLFMRMSSTGKALPQIPADTSNLPPRSQQGAMLLLMGSVQVLDDATRVNMRVVVTETSEIVEAGTGDAQGSSADSVQIAAENAIAKLPTLANQ
jgi:hypothetical protein